MKNYLYMLFIWIMETISFIFFFMLLGMPKDVMLTFYMYYFCVLCIFNHYRIKNNLIWSEMKDLVLIHFYYGFFSSFSILFYPEERFILFIKNIILILIMCVLILVLTRYSHIIFREQLASRTLLVGVSDNAQRIGAISHTNRFALMNVIGYVDYFGKSLEDTINKKPVYPFDSISEIIKKENINQVIIALPEANAKQLNEIVDQISGLVNQVKFVPSTYNLMDYESDIQDFDGILLVSTTKSKFKPFSKFCKRCIDIFAGICGCVLLLPVTIILKILFLKSGDKAPLIFTQERIGVNGKPIKIYKFRSMVPNAEQVLEELMAKDPVIREEYLTNKKLKNDPRITPIGDKLRKSSIDELPQLINVLKGEMTLVGPRPYLFREVDDMIYYEDIIKCKPGLTGMWQVSGRSDISFKERCRLDEYYYRNWSFWLDFTILIKTVKIVLYGDGAM